MDQPIVAVLAGDDGTRLVAEPEWGSWGEDGRSSFSIDSQELLEVGLRRYG